MKYLVRTKIHVNHIIKKYNLINYKIIADNKLLVNDLNIIEKNDYCVLDQNNQVKKKTFSYNLKIDNINKYKNFIFLYLYNNFYICDHFVNDNICTIKYSAYKSDIFYEQNINSHINEIKYLVDEVYDKLNVDKMIDNLFFNELFAKLNIKIEEYCNLFQKDFHFNNDEVIVYIYYCKLSVILLAKGYGVYSTGKSDILDVKKTINHLLDNFQNKNVQVIKKIFLLTKKIEQIYNADFKNTILFVRAYKNLLFSLIF